MKSAWNQGVMIMSKLIFSALLAAVLFTGTAPAMARSFTDMSKPHGGFAPDSPEGQRAFWDYRARQGGQ